MARRDEGEPRRGAAPHQLVPQKRRATPASERTLNQGCMGRIDSPGEGLARARKGWARSPFLALGFPTSTEWSITGDAEASLPENPKGRVLLGREEHRSPRSEPLL